MALTDRYGNPVSTRNSRAVELFDRAVAELNIFRIDPLTTIDQALAEDPSFVMGHAFKAGVLATTSERGGESVMRAALEAVEKSGAEPTDRERAYLAAIRAWLAGDFTGGAKLFGDISSEHPRDLFALQIAHLIDFLLGQATMLRDRPAQVRPHWRPGEPGYGYVLGMQAFGLEECGDYANAEALGREAIAADARDGWAAHAVAHVMEMRGRRREGIDWLRETSNGWAEGSFFAFHNWWHLSLYHLDEHEHGAVLELYDSLIRPGPSKAAMEMVDASALLWRLRLRGVDVGNRWGSLATSWSEFGETGYYAFNDVHALMAFLASDRGADVARIFEGLEAAARGEGTNAMMSRDVGLPVARALAAFETGRYSVTVDELLRVRGIAQRFGGSHAQRDVLHLTLVEAALRSGRKTLAQGLIAERLALRPASPFNLRLVRRAA